MNIFKLSLPEGRELPIVANLPHSGLFVPYSIAAQMTLQHWWSLPNSDWHLDRLYDFLPALGVTVLQATHSRYVVDLNRAVKPPIFGSFWSSVAPETTAFDQPIYQHKPTEAEVEQRIEAYYNPYHAKLEELLQQKIDRFGYVYLLDLHSFLGLIYDDICLGNRKGKTCSARMIDVVKYAFQSEHYQVVKNKVFNGGYITGHYGERSDVEALQIEVRYPVYLKQEQLDRADPPDWNVPELAAAKRKFERVFTIAINLLMHNKDGSA